MKAKKNWGSLYAKNEPKSAPENPQDKVLVQQKLDELREKIKDPDFARKVADLLSQWK